MNLPYGWTKDYALEWCVKEIERLSRVVIQQEHELARLDARKADRKGRPKSKPLSGDSGPPIA
jgi:hypothetical protein